MANTHGSETVNAGGVARPTKDEAARDHEIAGNAERKGEQPSPADRERGETSSADPAPPVDRDAAR